MLARTSAPLPEPTSSSEAAIPVARPARRRFRLVQAYAAALRVALSYLGFEALTWVLGPTWARRKRPALHRRNGRRVRRAILRLRGLFIKAGQLASVLTNLLPETFRGELEGSRTASRPARPKASATASGPSSAPSPRRCFWSSTRRPWRARRSRRSTAPGCLPPRRRGASLAATAWLRFVT